MHVVFQVILSHVSLASVSTKKSAGGIHKVRGMPGAILKGHKWMKVRFS